MWVGISHPRTHYEIGGHSRKVKNIPATPPGTVGGDTYCHGPGWGPP